MMDSDDPIPFEFVRQVADTLGYPIDEQGNYRPPVGTANLRLISPKWVAEQVLRKFRQLQAIHNSFKRHEANHKAEMAGKHLARRLWSENNLLPIDTVADAIHSRLWADGHKIQLSTCRTHAKAVHDELGLPTQKGRPTKKSKRKGPVC